MAEVKKRRGKWFWLQLGLIGLLTAKLVLAGFGFGRDWFGQVLDPQSAEAQEAGGKAKATKKGEPAEKAGTKTAKEGEKPASDKAPTPAAQAELLRTIERERARLAKQEAELDKKRQELLALQQDVDAKMAALKKLRQEFEAQVAEEKKRQNQRIKHLVALYSNMKPAAAAAVIEKMDEDIAVEIFRRMRGREAGKILANVKPELASRITKKLSESPEKTK